MRRWRRRVPVNVPWWLIIVTVGLLLTIRYLGDN